MHAVIERLAEVIERVGVDWFVAAPIVLPTPEFFPEPWRPSPAGVKQLARRLLAHVGLADARVQVEDHRLAVTPSQQSSIEHSEVLFAGCGGDTFVFELHAIGTAGDMLGKLAHEVVLAHREHHRVRPHPFRADPEPDDDAARAAELASLESVALGLGVLTTNAALREAVASNLVGREVHTERAWSSVGGLSPAEMAYLLALQLELRGDEEEAESAIAELDRERARDVSRWREEIEPERDALARQLRLPPRAAWPARRAPADQPLDGDDSDDGDGDGDGDDGEQDQLGRLTRFNAGQPVFRLAQRRAALPLALMLTLGAMAALIVGAVFESGIAIAGVAAGTGAVVIVGRRRKGPTSYECADPDCSHPLTLAATECPRCGGFVAGEVAHRDDRLEAADRLLYGESDD